MNITLSLIISVYVFPCLNTQHTACLLLVALFIGVFGVSSLDRGAYIPPVYNYGMGTMSAGGYQQPKKLKAYV